MYMCMCVCAILFNYLFFKRTSLFGWGEAIFNPSKTSRSKTDCEVIEKEEEKYHLFFVLFFFDQLRNFLTS